MNRKSLSNVAIVDTRNCPQKHPTLVSRPTGSQPFTLSSANSPASPDSTAHPHQPSLTPATMVWPTLPSPVSKVTVASNCDVELVSEEQATPISLPKSAFWPLINITEMEADGNCGFHAVAHTIHSQKPMWPEVRRHLLGHLNGNPAGYLHDVAITSSAEASPQSMQVSLMRFAGPIWDHSEWFGSDKHAQLTADVYNIFIVLVACNYGSIVIRAPSSFRSAEATRAAIPTARLLGMVFSSCSRGVGHWDSIDIERARELLEKRGHVGVCVSWGAGWRTGEAGGWGR